MKRSTEKLLKTIIAGTVVMGIGALIICYEYDNYVGTLFGSLLCFSGLVTATCGICVKCRCLAVEPMDPVVMAEIPLPLDCPAPPCCFEENFEVVQDEELQDNPSSRCCGL